MPKGQSSKIVFKQDQRNQYLLLPLDLNDMIPPDDMVRLVDQLINELDISLIVSTYNGGGTSVYHPAMLLKVYIYSYLNKIYTGRKIEEALKSNIKWMWISGKQQPDFRTLNNFRSSRMLGLMQPIFASVAELLIEKGYVSASILFIDGSKFEADANKYSYVWAKNTQRYKEGVKDAVRQLFSEIEEINRKENEEYGNEQLAELHNKSDLTSQDIKQLAQQINVTIQTKFEANGKLTKSEMKVMRVSDKLKKNLTPKLEKYEEQEKILGKRGSYSKTDHDGTFHRMKDGRLLPSYNVMTSTSNQFLMNYTIHQNPGDTHLLIDHLLNFKREQNLLPSNLVGDSAFGSQDNYTFLEQYGIGNYLKYNTFYRESKGIKGKYYDKEDFRYEQSEDYYECPSARKLTFKGTEFDRTNHGYITETKVYECEDCDGCPLSSKCRKGNGNRTLRINKELERQRKQARENLNSFTGKKLRSQRGIDVEPVFGDIKHNMGFRRFHVRGLEKVDVEFGLVAIAHNIKKMHKMDGKAVGMRLKSPEICLKSGKMAKIDKTVASTIINYYILLIHIMIKLRLPKNFTLSF